MNHQLSGYSVIVWAWVSVVQSGDRSLPIVYNLRLLLSDACSCNCSISMAVVGSNERLLKLIICWNCFNLELNSSSSRPTPLLWLCLPLLVPICRKPRCRRDRFDFRCAATTVTTGTASQWASSGTPLLLLGAVVVVAAAVVVVVVLVVLAVMDVVVWIAASGVLIGLITGVFIASVFSSVVIWMVMLAVVFISC